MMEVSMVDVVAVVVGFCALMASIDKALNRIFPTWELITLGLTIIIIMKDMEKL